MNWGTGLATVNLPLQRNHQRKIEEKPIFMQYRLFGAFINLSSAFMWQPLDEEQGHASERQTSPPVSNQSQLLLRRPQFSKRIHILILSQEQYRNL